MISYHIIASVSLAQREDLERQAKHMHEVQQGRLVRKRALRDARDRRDSPSPHWLPPTPAGALPTYPPGAGRLMPAALVLVALVLAALVLVPLVLVD
jgi:hypothetical protein